MHHIHTTPGFIIGARPYGEAGKILSIFTREFGLVAATAQGIRLEKSKLRYHTQEYSFGIFSLVKGKEFWRLTSAQEMSRHDGISQLASQSELIARLALLLKRLLQGEEAHPEVFDAIRSCAEFIVSNTELHADRLATLESLTVARILHWLGYIGDDKDLNGEVKNTNITIELLDELGSKRTIFNKHINKALKESQL